MAKSYGMVLLLVLPILWVGAGCRTQTHLLALQQENRQLEDRLYEVAGLLRDCRRENEKLRQELDRITAREDRSGLKDETPSVSRDDFDTDRRRTIYGSEAPRFEPGRTELPKIRVEGVPQPEEKTGELRPEASTPPASPVPPPGQLPVPPPPNFPQLLPEPDPSGSLGRSNREFSIMMGAVEATADNRLIERIEINRQLTGGLDTDGHPPDEGVVLLVAPLDAQGRFVRAAAAMSIVVLDPALPGEDARLARWDLSSQEVAACYRRGPVAEGIYLELPWQERKPVHQRLHLFVRYVTDDGRKLQADLPISVALATREARVTNVEQEPRLPTPGEEKPGQVMARDGEGRQIVRSSSAKSIFGGADGRGLPETIASQGTDPTRGSGSTPTSGGMGIVAAENSQSPAQTGIRAAERRRPAWTPVR